MQTTMLKAKLHRAIVTHAELNYEGSCAIDTHILELAGIREYEQIQIYNINNGERFTTYAISAEKHSKIFSINGAAAHRAHPGDLIIICTFASFNEQELVHYEPTLIYFDEQNNVSRSSHQIPIQQASS
jgi:aspartate 1-decarboxylase